MRKRIQGKTKPTLTSISDGNWKRKDFNDGRINFVSLPNRVIAISFNSQNESEKNQLDINTLEDPNNEYRAVFAIDKLNEGWDVLNLFDIVRLYDTRNAKNNIPGPTTIKKAQLIGREARYCPFKIKDSDDVYKWKFDHDIQNEMKICKELYYHSSYNPRYIQELNSVLAKTGIIPDNTIKRKLVVKKEFKNTEFFNSGLLFLNQQEKHPRDDVFELPRNFPYKLSLRTNINLSRGLFESQFKESVETKEKDYWKEQFFLSLKKECKIEQLGEDKKYIIWGMPFYNKVGEGVFNEEFNKELL